MVDDGDDGGVGCGGLNQPSCGGGNGGDGIDHFYSFDGGWNYPIYSTWNLLRQGSPCAACHVTHWTGMIPTNSQIDSNLVAYYRSQDNIAHQVHWAAFAYIGNSVTIARTTVVIGPFRQTPNYIDVADSIGGEYFQVKTGLPVQEVDILNEEFIVNHIDDGSRFVQSGTSSGPGLANEIRWLAQNGYTSVGDMVIEGGLNFGRSMYNLVGIFQY